MIRTCSLFALVLSLGLTVIGCGKKPPPPPDAPIQATPVEPGKAPKQKNLEAGVADPNAGKR